jgi:ferritin-like protein
MGQSSTTFHESADVLSPATRDMHRAIVSLMEELEAIDWYAQRVDAAGDGDLKQVLKHNGDEEKEHASMVLEWIRRHDPVFDRHLRTYLFTDLPIVGIEAGADGKDGGENGGKPRPSIGSLRSEGGR